MTVTDASAARLEGVWARHAVAHAEALRAADASWGTTWFALADGLVVLQGPGLYVNRALALGLAAPVAPSHLDELERAAAFVGVAPAVDVVAATDAALVSLLPDRGYTPGGVARVMTMCLDRVPAAAAVAGVVVRPITPDELPVWQQVSHDAWEHTSPTARRASDAYAAAAQATAGERLMLAFATDDGRPLGCASLTIRDGMATLGGMSTLHAERGRGVQRALVAQRIRLALDAGCDLAASSAVVAGTSERNLLRLGFTSQYVKTTWTRALMPDL